MPQDPEPRLLLVETEDVFRGHIAERLRLENFKVFEASRQCEARAILQRYNVDVVLLGMRESKQSGLSLLRSAKDMRPFTEFILMTPSESHSLFVSIEAMKLGAFDELLMPFDLESLLDRVISACQRKRQREKDKKPNLRTSREGMTGKKSVRTARQGNQ